MHDLFSAIIIVLVVFFVVKLLFPSKLPDYKVCVENKCWSTKSLHKQSTYDKQDDKQDDKRSTLQSVKDGMRDDMHDNEGAMLEVFTSPKDFRDTRDMLKDISDEPDITLNNSVKYSK